MSRRTASRPTTRKITGNPINDPNILDFVKLFDAAGNPIAFGTPEADAEAVVGVRRTTLAARLKAIYGDPNKLDAFVGMLSERHVHGSEFGELQLAMWKQQFQALRDGDRFFYQNDPVLPELRRLFGIDYRRTLAQIIEREHGHRRAGQRVRSRRGIGASRRRLSRGNPAPPAGFPLRAPGAPR